MLDVFNFPIPQSATYQEFYGNGGGGAVADQTWNKPRGASMVRFMLIGPGGGGFNGTVDNSGGGGGSGAVTSWIGPAIFIPDQLIIVAGYSGVSGITGTSSAVRYKGNSGTYYQLLTANAGISATSTSGAAGGTAMSGNYFTASGIFSSVAGQAGTAGNTTGGGTNQTASATTFLSGGAGGSGGAANTGGGVIPNYGYTALPATTAGGTVKGRDGYFVNGPIIVGCGGAGGTTNLTIGTAGGVGGIGCGGGGAGEDALTGGGQGGNGAVFVWAW